MNAERRAAVRDAASAVLHRPSDPLLLDTIADAIADAIEVALAWRPELPETVRLPRPERWGCGCDASECATQYQMARDSGTVNPQALVTISCIPHGLQGRSHPGALSDRGRLEAQAMLSLDLAHQEQCR